MTDATPRWRQIADALSTHIATLPPGTRLPTEAALSATHSANRHTVRRAIDSLTRAGLVRTEQGRGSFVADDVLDYAVAPRTRFSEWVRRHNREPAGQIIQLRQIPAPATIAADLGLASGATVVLLERVGLADRVPISLTRHYFDAARFPALLDALREQTTITAALAAAGVDDYRRLRTRVTARLPTAAEATLLATARARPVLVCANVNVDASGRAIESAVALYPSSRVHVVFEP